MNALCMWLQNKLKHPVRIPNIEEEKIVRKNPEISVEQVLNFLANIDDTEFKGSANIGSRFLKLSSLLLSITCICNQSLKLDL